MPDPIYDVAIVGAGPAGASAALVAAAGGLNVVILEKAVPPRYKTCGGGILGRAVRLMGDSPESVAEHCCKAVQFSLGPNLKFNVARPSPIIYMTMRDTFDDWLTRKAIAAGGATESDRAIKGLARERDHVRLLTHRGEIGARFIVAADGAASTMARLGGWPALRRVVPAVECEIEVTAGDFARLSTSARFDFDIVSAGYGWVFPKKSHLSIGVLSLNPGVNLKRAMTRYMGQLQITQPVSMQRHGYVIPMQPRHHVLARERIILTGDAAGLADPVTAEGISAAIQSGTLAGRAIVENRSTPARVCGAYNRAIHREILPELRWARRLATVLYKMPRVRDAVFRLHGQRLAEAMTLIVAGEATYGSLLGNPLNYLKLIGRTSH